MRLFISYARVDKPFCMQIAETLDIHKIWFDHRLKAGDVWWTEILRRLDWCQGFVYLLSPDSAKSLYCQKEYKIALNLGRQIFPVLIQEDTPIPEALRGVQYADFSKGLTPHSVKTLLNSIHSVERDLAAASVAPRKLTEVATSPAKIALPPAPSDPSVAFGKAIAAMDKGSYDEAVFGLKQALEHGLRSEFVDLEGLLREAETALELQSQARKIEREYKTIAELVKHGRTRELGIRAFRAFQHDIPDYDPENLAELCVSETAVSRIHGQNGTSGSYAHSSSAQKDTAPAVLRPQYSLPLLEWCEIPAGTVSIYNTSTNANGSGTHTYRIDTFRISKYPVTNAQYQYFLDDPQGYANLRWWDFSEYAREWRLLNPQPSTSQFQGDDRPRENVTWYEAMAFCFWLTEKLGKRVMLPTIQQWQRAARGDDNRAYPWGSAFNTALCNTRESRIRMSTLVMRYKNGVSPYGVYDLAGNVWEWCLNSNPTGELEISSNATRFVHGGSFMSAHERAQTTFNYSLSPESHYGSIGFRLATR